MTTLFTDISPDTALELLAKETGIHESYWDIAGTLHTTPDDTKRAILAAMGIAANTDAEAMHSLMSWRERPWTELAPPVLVLRRMGDTLPLFIDVSIHDNLQFSPLTWTLTLEHGEVHSGTVAVCDMETVDVADVHGETISRRRLHLSEYLPDGYHTLSLKFAGQTSTTRVIIAPKQAFIPDWMEDGERQWGLSCQTYALRKDTDWGIGDFSALSDYMNSANELGANMVGINPMHALFQPWPDACSPYSPSSRSYLNPLLIAFDRITFAEDCPTYQQLINGRDFQKALKSARSSQDVDYPAVMDLKVKALRALFQDFRNDPTGKNHHDFEAYCDREGQDLRRFAQFCALHETLGGLPWHSWPVPLRVPTSMDVEGFTAANIESVTFHAFLQWLCATQLAEITAENPNIGLYRDLAIGGNMDGADVWAHQDGIAKDVTFGAPPDAFSAVGQDWGLPPLHPHVLRDTAYEGFIRMVRANMAHASALRIDHVMGLMRLFWIPNGLPAVDGAYVSYPFADILGILALESHRNHCVLIGEDLGTVPEDFRDRMDKERLLSYRVTYFERWESGLFRRPEIYPPLALSTPTTHDMPSIAGHWCGTDIKLRQTIGTFGTDADIEAEYVHREETRKALFAALEDQDLSPARPPCEDDPDSLKELTHSVHRFTARTPSQLLIVNPSDLLCDMNQINLPGTVHEHPNWRQRMTIAAANIAEHPDIQAGVKAILEERS